MPVEVEETKAREWFRFLLSGVEFLHKRGVVHNDIKSVHSSQAGTLADLFDLQTFQYFTLT